MVCIPPVPGTFTLPRGPLGWHGGGPPGLMYAYTHITLEKHHCQFSLGTT